MMDEKQAEKEKKKVKTYRDAKLKSLLKGKVSAGIRETEYQKIILRKNATITEKSLDKT